MAGVVLLEDILSISGIQIVYRVDTAILPPGDPEDQRRGADILCELRTAGSAGPAGSLDDQAFAGRDARFL